MGSFIGLLAQLIMATTVFAMNMLLVGIAGLLRLLPTFLPVLGRALWALLILSCRLYYLTLTRAAPYIRQYLGIQILRGLVRPATTVAMSLLVGLVLLWLAEWPLMIWTVLPFVLHGLFVDFVWDEIPDTGGLQMGTRL